MNYCGYWCYLWWLLFAFKFVFRVKRRKVELSESITNLEASSTLGEPSKVSGGALLSTFVLCSNIFHKILFLFDSFIMPVHSFPFYLGFLLHYCWWSFSHCALARSTWLFLVYVFWHSEFSTWNLCISLSFSLGMYFFCRVIIRGGHMSTSWCLCWDVYEVWTKNGWWHWCCLWLRT